LGEQAIVVRSTKQKQEMVKGEKIIWKNIFETPLVEEKTKKLHHTGARKCSLCTVQTKDRHPLGGQGELTYWGGDVGHTARYPTGGGGDLPRTCEEKP